MDFSASAGISIAFSNLIMLALDAAWISQNYPSYKRNTENIQKNIMTVKILPAAIAYLLLAVAVALCIIQDKPIWWHNTLHGAIMGLIIYGVYNATSAAILSDFNTTIAIKDTIWGTMLMAATITAGHFIKKSFKKYFT